MKDILVTGAFGGMGKATVKALAARGYRVFALDLKTEPCDDNIIPIQADITNDESVLSAFDSVAVHTQNLYAIIHFAGIYMLDSLIEMSQEEFKRIFEINLFGASLINKTFLPLLKSGSKILMTTSELAPLNPLPFTGIYAISKAALDKYAYSLRMELQLLGISVSVLRAGAVDTGMLGASCAALDKFCEKTELYSCNAHRFKKIVDKVEARCISPEKLSKRVLKITEKRRPRFSFSINRNPLLLLLNIMPRRFQFWIIRKILK